MLDPTRQDKNGNQLITLRYGDHSYLTHGREFAIRLVNGQWQISDHLADTDTVNTVGGAGLFQATFSRRKDAVVALEALFDSIGDNSV